ncbi:hypothetical protein HPP92_000844 [Vanilla planifolia]|uniref:GTD-binding domain-containing protein n=1 Tax=Vanilla planifolia TaxID=51239 RepID=A0A835SAW8_VANPL|nr:hypothetical protein HPP92_000844 [Vanilla planifolia]
MDSATQSSASSAAGGRCGCGCPSCSAPSLSGFHRSLKRKADQPSREPPLPDFARVEVENEVAALRETLASQQGVIQELSTELEEERSAAATAASETMSMILRLQREKAEVQMEARQFRRFAEEKMAHDGREIEALEDLLFRREQEAQTLSCEVRSYKNRLISLGTPVARDTIFPNSSPAAARNDDFYLRRGASYPALLCDADSHKDEATDFKRQSSDTREQLSDLEQRIYELETSPVSNSTNFVDPQRRHQRGFSNDSHSIMRASSTFINENGEGLEDETSRVYTVDAIHGVSASSGAIEEQSSSKKLNEEKNQEGYFDDNGDQDHIKKLCNRLQALEADRESMRQAIISMRTEKAQLVLLREVAQHLCKEVKPERKIVRKKPSLCRSFFMAALFKLIMPFLSWRKKASRSRYPFGLSTSNVGLLQILDKTSQMGHWRHITRTTMTSR